MNNLELYNKMRSVPNEAKKSIGGGRLKGMTDINPMWRIKTLTENFGVCGFGWYYDITGQEIKAGANGEMIACVTINLFVKLDEVWSKPIQGLGGSMFVANEKNGAYTSDECFKMALTDAISVACKALGIGADVYWEKDRTKYDQQQDKPEPKPQPEPEAKPTIAPEVVESIERAVMLCETMTDLTLIWNRNKELHAKDFFINIIKTRRGQIEKQKVN